MNYLQGYAASQVEFWNGQIAVFDRKLAKGHNTDLFAKREMIRCTVAQLELLGAALGPTT